ncbi:hypothetical protein [Sediminibacterium soli]|uniref:hypothetical protein n=1 Tax=Sediminibacterium soli TaxID=2698829 RepID=UPI00192A32D0|nr:hypothetical protein [Sediminibacterium soli]NCI45540.1 hypothetical protein [Sediminibacterium soli]
MTKNNQQPRERMQVINQKKAKPENKDDIDSRKNEEWQTKGNDVTHTHKEHHSKKPGTHR